MTRPVLRARIEQHGRTAEVGVYNYAAAALRGPFRGLILPHVRFESAYFRVTGESRSYYPL